MTFPFVTSYFGRVTLEILIKSRGLTIGEVVTLWIFMLFFAVSPWLDFRSWLDLIFLMISYVGRKWLKITHDIMGYLLFIKLLIHHAMVLYGAQRKSTIFCSSINVLHTPVILLPRITIVSGHMIKISKWKPT